MTYTTRDFESVAQSVDRPLELVVRHEGHFEAAAMFYRAAKRSPKRTPPSILERRLTRIGNRASDLLLALGVSDASNSADGPTSDILDVLASADLGEERLVLQSTTRVGQMAEALEILSAAAGAAKTIQNVAKSANQDVTEIHKRIVPPGNKGNDAVNDWIVDMFPIYRAITGSNIGTSVGSPESATEGQARGPLICFLTAAGKPLGIENTSEAWRERVRLIRRSRTLSP